MITGPAILKIGSGPYLYSAAGFTVSFKTATGDIPSDLHGPLGKFAISQMATITGKEVGRITSAILATLLPLGVGNVGQSVLTSADVAVEIWTQAGQKITWARGGITKYPDLMLSAKASLFASDFEVTCLGAATTSGATSPTSAAHWNAITTAAFTESSTTGFDASKIQRYRYTAAFGSSPYDAMTGQDGFKVSIAQATQTIPDDNQGIGDIIMLGLTAGVTFTPSNLTEAQVATLVALQGTSARLPGDLIGGTTNLVITGTGASSGFALTLNKAGFSDADMVYKSGALRTGQVQGWAARSFTAGVADALFTLTVS